VEDRAPVRTPWPPICLPPTHAVPMSR